jgi:hypothetical protein
VILFDPRIERGSQSIGERWRQLDVAKRTVDLIVVRGSSKTFFDAVENDEVLRDVVGETPLLTLAGSWDPGDREPQLRPPSWSAKNDLEIDPGELRNYELLTLILQTDAVYRTDGCHFRLPSSRFHAEAFIRLADALDDHTDLLRLADWILPDLDPETALLGDNGSLLGLLAVASQEALRRFGWDLPVATLNRYPTSTEAIRSFVDGFGAQDWARLLFLITVSSSGSISDRVAALRDEGIDVDVLVLCGTDPPPGDPAPGSPRCFSRYVISRWRAGADQRCPKCPDQQILIVDPRTYEVKATMEKRQYGIDIPEAERCARFWEAVDGRDAVSLHVQVETAEGNPAGSRHLGVALDIPALLGDDWFRSLCVEKLRSRPKPDLALIPKHAAAAALGEVIEEAHGLDAGSILEVPIGDFAPDTVERLRQASRALLADDVVITAETLVALRRRIYEAAPKLEIWGFAPVLRPPSQLEKSHLLRPFQGPSAEGSEQRFTAGFELFLPPPGEEGCPWCAERTLLADRLSGLEGVPRKVADARLRRLRRSSGLEPPLLLYGDDEDGRTEGSYFGALRSRAGFAAASAVGQKQKESFQRERRVNELRYFNTALALDAFFDAVLLAGMLRTFDRRDLRDIARDEEVGRALGEYQMSDATLVEATYAAVVDKLPADLVRERLERSKLGETAELLLALVG